MTGSKAPAAVLFYKGIRELNNDVERFTHPSRSVRSTAALSSVAVSARAAAERNHEPNNLSRGHPERSH
jgi:hypothetical protein